MPAIGSECEMDEESLKRAIENLRKGVATNDDINCLWTFIGRIAKSIVGPSGAEDVVQEVLVTVWRYTGTAIGKYSPWLSTVTRRRAIDHWRRMGRSQCTTQTELEDLLDAAGNRIRIDSNSDISAERLARLRAAIDSLPPGDAQIIHWRYVEQKTFKEIAELLQCTEHAAKQRCHRIREKLRRKLEKNNEN